MAFSEFNGKLDDELPGYVEFDGQLDKPESKLDKVKSVVSRGVDAGLAILTPKRSIADQAQEQSASAAGLSAPQVKGAPVRRDFYNKMVAETPLGEIAAGPGIVSRTRNAAANDIQAQRGKQAVASAITSPEQEEGIGFLGTLKEGAKGTARNIGATVDTLQGDADDVISASRNAENAEKDPALSALLADIDARKKAIGENPGWLDAIKAVGGAAIDNPKGAGLLIAEQFPNSAAALGAGFAGMKLGAGVGSLAGPAGTLPGAVIGGIAGMFGANTALETGGKAIEAATDGTFSPEEQSRVLKEGVIKGGVITGVDAATLGLTNFIMGTTARAVERATVKTLIDKGVDVTNKAAVLAATKDPAIAASVKSAQALAQTASTTLGQRLARVGGATGLETVGEGAGEYLGEFAATGKADKVEAVIEALSSLGQSAGEVAFTAARNKARLATIAGKPVEELSDSVLKYTANRGSERAKAAAQAELDRRSAQGVDPVVANAPESTSDAVDRIISTGQDKAREIRESAAASPDAIQSDVFDEPDHAGDANDMMQQQPVDDAPTPEPLITLNAQLNALAEGRKPGMLLAPGEPLPTALPEGVQAAEIPGRGTLLYRDDATLQAALDNRMGEALGYGIDEKPAAATQVVTARDQNGAVIQDVATDGRPEVAQAAAAVAGPSGSVEVRPIQQAMAERSGENGAGTERPKDAYHFKANINLGLTSGGKFTKDKSQWITFTRKEAMRMSGSKPPGASRRGIFVHSSWAESEDQASLPSPEPTKETRPEPKPSIESKPREAQSPAGSAKAHNRVAIDAAAVRADSTLFPQDKTGQPSAMAVRRARIFEEIMSRTESRPFVSEVGDNHVEISTDPDADGKVVTLRIKKDAIKSEKQETHPLRPLVESLIKRRAAAKQGGKDLSNAIARAKEVLDGKREPSTVENRWFRLQAKAFERADMESANILRQIAEVVKPEKPVALKQPKIQQRRKKLEAIFSRHKAKAESKQATQPGGLSVSGLRKSKVQTIVDALRSQWKNAPEIVVVDDMSDPAIRKAVRDENERQMSQGATGQPEGFFDQGKVYIVASEMNSPADVVRVLFHETLGHFGLRGAFGKELKPILKQIAALRRADVEAKAKQYGLDMSVEKDRLTAAEEVLAEFSQSRPQISFVKRAIATIRTWLRENIPFLADMKLSDAEIINNFLMPAREFVRNGEKPAGRADVSRAQPVFQRVFHGTPHIWPPEPGFPHGRPRLDKMGTGEGAQAFGWGWYSAENQGVASGYHKALASVTRAHIAFAGQKITPKMLGDLQSSPDPDIADFFKYEYAPKFYTPKKVIPWLDEKIASAKSEQAKFEKRVEERKNTEVIAATYSVEQLQDLADQQSKKAARLQKIRDLHEHVPDKRGGALYSLDIPDSALPYMLDWDKPLSEQTPDVRASLGKLSDKIIDAWKTNGAWPHIKGETLYRHLADGLTKAAGREGKHKAASELLASLGIVGNRYLDGGSRAGGDGTHNFVIWDQNTLDKIAMLERNSEALDAIRDAATFSNPNIRFSRSAPGNSASSEPSGINRIVDSLIFNFQDRFKDLRDIQKEAGPVDEELDASLAETLYSGRVRARMDDFRDDMRDPLIQAIHDGKLKYDEVEEFLHALHAPSRNAAMKEINPTRQGLDARIAKLAATRDKLSNDKNVVEFIQKRRELRQAQSDVEDGLVDPTAEILLDREVSKLRKEKPVKDYIQAVDQLKRLQNTKPFDGDNAALSGMSDAESKKVIQKAKETGKLEALQRISSLVDEITAATRKVIVDAGLETPEMIAAWEAKYEHYVPLHRDEVGENTNPVIGQGFNIRGRESKRATGSNKAVTDILAHVVAQHEAAIVRAEKSKVDNALFEFAIEHPDPELWSVDVTDTKREVDPVTGLVVDRVDPLYKKRDNVLTLKIDGEEHTIEFTEKNPAAMRLASSIKNLSAQQLGEVTQAVGKFTRFLATMNTTANPVFVARNFLRDLQTAYVNLSDTELAGMKRQVFSDVPKAIRGMWQLARGDMNSQWAKDAREFRDAGGQVGWMDNYKDIGERAGKLRSQLKMMGPGKWNLTRRIAKDWWELIEDANSAVENGIRLAVYVNARKAGLSEGKSGSIAKGLTVNFNLKGAKSTELNMWYMFMNASIQGTARLVKALGNKRVQQIVGGIAASGFLMDILARSLAGDDDDDGENDYDQLPEHVKAMNWVFWVDGRPVTIPMPYGYNFFSSVGRKISEVIFRENYSPVRSAVDLAAVFFDAFSPVGQVGSALQFFSPTITDPLAQWSENKNFAGNPMRREQSPFGVPKPEYQMGFKSTSAPAKWLAEFLNEATGGNEVRPGFVDVNPAMLDFVVSSVAGGAGRTYLQAFSLPIKAAQDEEIQAREVPFANIFLSAKPEYQTERKFYENLKSVNLAQEELNNFRGDSEKRAELREDHGELKLAVRAKFVSNIMANIRKRERLIEKSNPEDRKAQLKAMEERKRKVMSDFNRQYVEATR